jgi:hypothetical protein
MIKENDDIQIRAVINGWSVSKIIRKDYTTGNDEEMVFQSFIELTTWLSQHFTHRSHVLVPDAHPASPGEDDTDFIDRMALEAFQRGTAPFGRDGTFVRDSQSEIVFAAPDTTTASRVLARINWLVSHESTQYHVPGAGTWETKLPPGENRVVDDISGDDPAPEYLIDVAARNCIKNGIMPFRVVENGIVDNRGQRMLFTGGIGDPNAASKAKRVLDRINEILKNKSK